MGIIQAVRDFEARHPVVQHMLAAISVDHLAEADRVAAKFEDVAGHIASVLPDGPEIQAILSLIAKAQFAAVNAVATLEGGSLTPPTAAAPAAPVFVPGFRPAAPVPVYTPAAPVGAAALIPGRDHPITEPPPAAEPAQAPVAPVAVAPATVPAPVAQAPAQPAAAVTEADVAAAHDVIARAIAQGAVNVLSPYLTDAGNGAPGTGEVKDSGPAGIAIGDQATAQA